jgi:uncharacterized circularly permuted ATP-grasp superfamily protein/uncharacterized alpha-E superfamily protein
MVKNGLLPVELVFEQNSLLLACDGLPMTNDRPLVFYAADLGRLPNGELRVIGDRTQAPAGAGYALENRIVLSRVLPSLFRDSHVHRLSTFFRTLRTTLRSLAPRANHSSRIVLLTPGPRNSAYFEHAYLANYLGYTLAQGDDLTVRDGAVWIKTLNGLDRVDVLMRRLHDQWCDPLELRGDSLLGVPGLMQAVRAGNVTLANGLGCSILEHPAMTAFLPRICKELLGEDLHMPGVQTWWCGEPKGQNHVLSNLQRLVIKRVGDEDDKPCILGSELSEVERARLKAEIKATPSAFVGQEPIPVATAPVFADGQIKPQPAILRTFLVAEDDGYAVMPGGLTRVTLPEQGSQIISSKLGGIGKDTWVLATEPERDETLITKAAAYSPAVREESEVSSRVADNLYWMGRYAERAENLVRLLRIIVMRSGEQINEGRAFEEVRCLHLLLQALTHQTLTYPGFVGEGAEQRLAAPDEELLSLLTDIERVGGLPQTLQSLGFAAWSVRDRLSMDTWRVVNAIDEQLQELMSTPADLLEQALDELDPLITALVAFSGLTKENMTRDEGWRFLEFGRRLERSVNTVTLMQTSLVPHSGEVAEAMVAESVLEVTDSLNTYRRRYQSGTQVGALLDLIFQDEDNPRSVAFQLVKLNDLALRLPRKHVGRNLSSAQKLLLEAMTAIRLADIDQLAGVPPKEKTRVVLAELLERLASILPALSNDITALYFRHEDRPYSLLSRRS